MLYFNTENFQPSKSRGGPLLGAFRAVHSLLTRNDRTISEFQSFAEAFVSIAGILSPQIVYFKERKA